MTRPISARERALMDERQEVLAGTQPRPVAAERAAEIVQQLRDEACVHDAAVDREVRASEVDLDEVEQRLGIAGAVFLTWGRQGVYICETEGGDTVCGLGRSIPGKPHDVDFIYGLARSKAHRHLATMRAKGVLRPARAGDRDGDPA